MVINFDPCPNVCFSSGLMGPMRSGNEAFEHRDHLSTLDSPLFLRKAGQSRGLRFARHAGHTQTNSEGSLRTYCQGPFNILYRYMSVRCPGLSNGQRLHNLRKHALLSELHLLWNQLKTTVASTLLPLGLCAGAVRQLGAFPGETSGRAFKTSEEYKSLCLP